MNELRLQQGEPIELTDEEKAERITAFKEAEGLMKNHAETSAMVYEPEVLRAQYCRDELLGAIEKIANIFDITDQSYIASAQNECRSSYNNFVRRTLITIPEGSTPAEATVLLSVAMNQLVDSIMANAEDFTYIQDGITKDVEGFERELMLMSVFQGVLIPILRKYQLDRLTQSEELSKAVNPYLAALGKNTIEQGTEDFRRVKEVVSNEDYMKVLLECLPHTMDPDPSKITEQVRQQLALFKELGQNSVSEKDPGSYINKWEATFTLHKSLDPTSNGFPQSN